MLPCSRPPLGQRLCSKIILQLTTTHLLAALCWWTRCGLQPDLFCPPVCFVHISRRSCGLNQACFCDKERNGIIP